MKYLEYFGMQREPFRDDLPEKDILHLPGTLSVKQRMDYVLNTGGIMVVTGEIGSGKSTSIRWSLKQYHPSDINFFYVTANSGSSNELYKLLCWEVKLNLRSGSKSFLLKSFKDTVSDILKKDRNKIIIVIDEASLLRADVFAELHTLNQFNLDSERRFTLVLVGQNLLIDKLKYHSSAPIASRVMTRAHLPVITEEQMSEYINHHLKLCGAKRIYSKNAISAIWQGSGGLLRKANYLAKGALIGCMSDNVNVVTEEHVRRASTELV